MENLAPKITEENYETHVLRSRARQAGVSLIFDPDRESFIYNTYCLELKLLKELFTHEYDSLKEALDSLHEEFGSWQLAEVGTPLPSASKGCGGCSSGGCSSGGCCSSQEGSSGTKSGGCCGQ
jgi:hypothetical protein